MYVDCYHELDDASAETIALVADLLEASRTEEHMVYREAELDEIWRWLEVARMGAAPAEATAIAARADEVHAVHDMTEDPANARAAANRLRALVTPAHA